MIGTALNDRYRIAGELGRGGMGVVYRAHDTRLKRDVAVKVLSTAGLGTEGRARLMNEAEAAARLNHPNIVAVYDAGEAVLEPGRVVPFVVMELLDGPTMHQQPPADLEEALVVARQLCAALDHAHRHGVVHRDLKPENIMHLGRRSTVKLMDFGLAQSVASRLTVEGTVMGTLFYLAPEMIQGQDVDGRADLYALGTILYEWTAGRLPFEATDPVAVLTQHLHAPIVPPSVHNPDLPPALETLILQLLAKDPARRPATAADVLEALDHPDELYKIAPPPRELSLLDRIVRGRLVGRETELAQARALWALACAGQGQLLLLSGEPGVGKSRLAEELATQAVAGGGRVLEGASYAESATPYAPFREILRQAVKTILAKEPSLAAQGFPNLLALAPDLRQVLPTSLPSNGGLAGLDQDQLLEELVLFVSLLSQTKPLLLLLEDVHWADSATLAALRHLARQTRLLPVMIVATYREVEIDQARAFHQLLLDFTRERLGQRLKLARLDRQDTEALLRVLFDEEITPDFLESIYRETEGNPFFVEEICKALVDSGRLFFEDGRWHRPPVAELGVPQSIQVAVQARVQALSAGAQAILELAAILGRDFEFETLVRASGETEEAVIDALDEALAAQLVEEAASREVETYSFVHALIPTTLVGTLRTLRRRRLHRQVAAALEVTQPDAYEALAHHFVEGAEMEKGIDYLIKAGDRAQLLYAHEEAIDAYESALEHLREQGQVARAAQILMKLGGVYHSAFEFARSHQAYEEGFSLRRQSEELGLDGDLPPAPHPLRLDMWEPQTLDPAQVRDNYDVTLADQLFSGLVEFTQDLDVVPDVAQRWEILNDGRRYRFYLRQDVAWSDGQPVTAADFAVALRRLLEPGQDAPLAHLFFDIKGAQAFHSGLVDDPSSLGLRANEKYILEVELEGPSAYFLQVLTYLKPLPRHAVEEHGPDWTSPDRIVTNGPFLLHSWQPGEFMSLVRNPGFHGRFPGNLSSVELHFGRTTEEQIADYVGDRLEVLGLLQAGADDIRLRRQFADDYLVWHMLGTYYLTFNWSQAPFDDVRVRQAFALTLNLEHHANVVLEGLFPPATGGFVPPGMAGHAPGIAPPFDPDQARRLLAEAGYPNGRGFPAVSYLVAGPRSHHSHSELVRGWRQHLGVHVVWEHMPWEKFRQRVRDNPPHLSAAGWTPFYPDPDDFLRVNLANTRERHGGWQNERYLGLIQEARRLTDQRQRLALYAQAQQLLAAEVPILPITYFRGHTLVKPWVRRTPFSPLKSWHWKEVIIDQHD